MSKRQPGLDLLRCFCTLLVVVGHSFLSNSYTITAQTGVTMWVMDTIHQLTRGSVGVFLMLTGYLQGHKTDLKACYRGLSPVLLGYLIASAISIPVRHFVFGDVQSLATWGQRLLGFNGAYYGWYVEIYVGLALLTPFINICMNHISNKALVGFAAVLTVLATFPGFTPWVVIPDAWVALYPLAYYVLGAVIRRTQPKIKPVFGILGTIALCAFWGAITIFSTDGTLYDSVYWNFWDFPSVTVAVFLFIGCYQIEIPKIPSRIIAFAATGSYGAYMLSHLLDAVCYSWVMPWRKDGKFLLIFLCVTLPIYLVSMVMGIGLDRITRLLLGWGQKLANGVKKRFTKEISTVE